MGIGWLVDDDAGSCKMIHVSNVQHLCPTGLKTQHQAVANGKRDIH